MDVKLDLSVLGKLVVEQAAKAKKAAARVQSVNNLKQIALAMHNFHDVNKQFPPAASYDKDGKPLLSWRVMILPYIEQNALFERFHLDEPWDSEHNKNLIAQMPRTYAAPDAKLKPGETCYLGFIGRGAFFEGKKGTAINTITDGTSNTLMIVEAATSVPWTKPEDLPFDPAKPLPKLGVRPPGPCAALCDGSVRVLSAKMSPEKLRALITRNGGEVISNDD